MKKVATIVLNRNLPKETDALCEKIKKYDSDITDVFVVESGSDKGNLSKGNTWWADWPEALEHGLRYPRGFNFGLASLLKEGKYDQYDYFFLVCNDAEIPEAPIVSQLLETMVAHPRVGILSPCSKAWGEKDLMNDKSDIRYFWHVSHVAWMVRRQYIDDVREVSDPNYMNFLYDGENFRGYQSEVELIAKGYINDWATAITTKVMVEENKSHLLKKADLIHTEPFEESLKMCLDEGGKWMRKKYGFNSQWSMQMYAKFFYDKFFEHYPNLNQFKV